MKKAIVFLTGVVVVFLGLAFGGVYCMMRHERATRLSRGCDKPESRIENVERVLTDMNGCYELLTLDPQSKEVNERQFCGYVYQRSTEIRLFADALSGQPMWADYRFKEQDKNGYCHYELDIHMHSAKDVNGGGWQRTVGKQSQRGGVEVIE